MLAVFTVDSIANDGPGTLRDAIEQANVSEESDEILFDASLSGQTILLEDDSLVIEDYFSEEYAVVIDATSLPEGLTIDGGDASHVIGNSSTSTELHGLTLTGGRNWTVSNGGELLLEGVTIRDSSSTAIYNSGTITISKSLVTGSQYGIPHALENRGTALVIDSTFAPAGIAFNTAPVIRNAFTATSLSVVRSTIGTPPELNSLRPSPYYGFSIQQDGFSGDPRRFRSRIFVSNSIILGKLNGVFEGDHNLLAQDYEFFTGGEHNLVGVGPLLGPLADNGGPTLTHALLPGSPALDAGDPTVAPGGTDQRGGPYARVADGGSGTARIDIGAYEAQVAPTSVPGDFNADGSVDAVDYTVWRDSLGSVVAPFTSGDATGDGVVDEADYATFVDHFGVFPVPSPLVVNDLGNNDDGSIYNGRTTLREAINFANRTVWANSITFDPALSGETIFVNTRHSESINEYAIYNDLTIDARMLEEGITLDGGDQTRIFNADAYYRRSDVFAYIDLTLAGLTLIGGNGDSRTLFSSRDGGAVRFASQGDLTVIESTIRDSRGGLGGGIYSIGHVTLIDSLIEGTEATREDGGGIYAGSGVALIRSEIRNTTAADSGGGISTGTTSPFYPGRRTPQNIVLTDSLIVGAHADGKGGGISTTDDVTLLRSQVDNNTASSYGAGVVSTGRSIFTMDFETIHVGKITLTDSSVSGNTSEQGNRLAGAGIVAQREVSLLRSHVDNNTVLDGGEGGGIATESLVLLNESTVNGNSAELGGGIYATGQYDDRDFDPSSSIITLIDSEVNNNTSLQGGGGIHSFGSISIMGSHINGNRVNNESYQGESAGAIYLDGSPDDFLELVDSVVSNNRHNLSTPVIFATSGDRVEILRSEITDNIGGGVQAHLVIDSTISRNEGIGVIFVGDESIIGSTISENSGGGIQAGDLTIIDSVIRDNTKSNFTEPHPRGFGSSPGGAGINASSVRLLRTLVEGNQTFGNGIIGGGGIYTQYLTAVESTIRDNASHGNGTHGGGIYARNSTYLYETTVSGNATYGDSAEGGGIYSEFYTLAVQSTLSGNETHGAGSHGGGISTRIFETKQSTITDNHAEAADANGGGVYSRSSSNKIDSTILAGNFAGAAGNDLFMAGTSVVNYSLIGDINGSGIDSSTGTGNRLDVDPRLGPLADNGGPTLTHALLPGSPALDAGSPAIDLDTLLPNPGLFEDYTPVAGFDARLAPFARVADGGSGAVRIDIGAYEAQAAPQGMPGDYNRDGTVDLADFTLWRIGEGTVVSPLSGADGNGDGVVDLGDYRTWKTHYGHSYTPPVVAVAFLQASDEPDSAFQSPNRQVVDEAFAINERDLLLVSISGDDRDEDDREQPFQGERADADEADGHSLALAFASFSL